MHFSRPTLFILTLLTLLSALTLISAEKSFSDACRQCLVAARIRHVPSCEGIAANTESTNSTAMTPQERSCLCGAANSDAWVQSCAKTDVCDNFTIIAMTSVYGPIKLACIAAGVSSISGASSTWASKTAVAAVAIAASALGSLL